MRLWRVVALFLSPALLLPSPAAAQAPAAQPGAGDNAALKYWTAFALLPALDKEQQKLLDGWNTAPLDAAALRLLERSRNSLVYLHRGAKLPRCDWAPAYEDGILLVLPHLPKARALARLAALHARHEFEQGHWKAGAEDVAALLQLARHLKMDRMIIPHLVGYSVEALAIEAAAPYLPELKSALPAAASAVLATPPTGPTLTQQVLLEKQIGATWFLQELKKAERNKAGSWQDVWKEVLGAPEEGDRVDRGLVNSAKSFEQAVKLLEDLLPYYDELAKVAALSPKEFDAQYPEFVKKAKAANPLAGYVLPNMGKVVAAERRAEARLALFKAALAVVQGGPDKLKEIKDPFGDGPFEYRALDRGFELKSKLLSNGKPVTLVVGKGK
jgi:hypothetical protein